MHKHITRGIPSAQLLSANSSSLPSIPPKDGALRPANEQYSRQQLKLFERRCQTLAHRVSCNQLNFIDDAVDMAYDAATADWQTLSGTMWSRRPWPVPS
jgi:hypothetical protein